MAPEPSTGRIKNVFARVGRHLRPGSSRTASRSTSLNPSKPPTSTLQMLQQHVFEDPVKTAWKAMELALRMLEKSADVFPPLKSAVGGLVACLDLAKNVTGNQKEYVKLAMELEEMADTLRPHASQLVAAGGGGSIDLILKSIDEELVEIKEQQDRSKSEKIFEAADDQGDILTRYRKINSLFRRLMSDVALRNHIEIGKLREATEARLLRTLKPIGDARYNSRYSTSIKRRGCTPSTRERILDDLRTWAKDPQGSKVFWMNGMAGTGKTTILYSFCEWLEENKRLAANFFCSRYSKADCGDLNNIMPSIAYQLAHYSPAFHSQLCRILEKENNPQDLRVEAQFERIVKTPLQNSKDAIPDGAVIVIDALDECDDVSATEPLLNVLLQSATQLPIKFMVASRPEPVIRKTMEAPTFPHSVLRLHDIDQSVVEADIRHYLQQELSTMMPVPSSEIIDQLTQRSGKLFIYAATVTRYINPKDEEVNAETRLGAILGISTPPAKLKYQELDQLYMYILLSAFDKTRLEDGELKIRALVLRTVICAVEPMATSTMSTILALRQGDVASALSRLRSVIHIQEGPSGLVSVLHASFPDFLTNETRSHDFYCNIVEHNTKLAHSCFDVMCKELHFNMCDLENSYDFDEDVPDLDQKIQANISAVLLYACKYWSNHLVRCSLTSSIHYRLIEFLKFRLLFWMEVLNLTKSITIGSQILSNVLAWFIRKAPDHTFEETEKELHDSDFFLRTFSLGACRNSTPHIYISALPFCNKTNSVFQNYWSQTNGLVVANGTSLTQQHNRPIGVWKTDAAINTVAFSPDSSTFAAGCRDVLEIRDVQSGEVTFNFSPLPGDTRQTMQAVIFSPDNSKIATASSKRRTLGSSKGIVRIWDIQTANLIAGPLLNMEGSQRYVQALAFSWDSKKLALYSGSTVVVWDSSSGAVLSGPFATKDLGNYGSFAFTPDDSNILLVSSSGTVHILDARTGIDLTKPFQVTNEELGQLLSTAISPDTTMVAVGYGRGTIYVGDVHARIAIHSMFIGHREAVSTLAFSIDGKKLISGSHDRTIRIWDIDTGNVVAGPFEGHTGTIRSLALSSDGTKILSGSNDWSVRLWNVFTSKSNIAPQCQSVSDAVYAVAWSPDGTTIASGQCDGNINVWSAQSGEAVMEPIRYSFHILSIAFSPDGSRLSAGAVDGAVVSWDSKTGGMVGKPFLGHCSLVSSIVYSPDGSMIASGSRDRTIIIWDCSTGKRIGKLFHHNKWVHSVAFTPDGNRLVAGVEDGSIYVWDVHTGQIFLGPMEGHKRPVYSVACSIDQLQFVSGSGDGTVCVWSMTTGKMTAGPFDYVDHHVTSVAYSRDGTKLIFGCNKGTICVLDAETGNILASFDAHTSGVTSVAVSPDGSKFISGSKDGSLRLWQLDILTSSELLRNAPTIWMPEDVLSPDISNIAKYHDNGWVVLDDKHLFWTPPEFREDLCYPYNPITIGPHGTTCIDYSPSKLFIGKTWSNCWIYGPTAKTSITQ